MLVGPVISWPRSLTKSAAPNQECYRWLCFYIQKVVTDSPITLHVIKMVEAAHNFPADVSPGGISPGVPKSLVLFAEFWS
jgi:hypothetical protein